MGGIEIREQENPRSLRATRVSNQWRRVCWAWVALGADGRICKDRLQCIGFLESEGMWRELDSLETLVNPAFYLDGAQQGTLALLLLYGGEPAGYEMDMLQDFTLRMRGSFKSAMVATALLATIFTPQIEAVMVKEVSVSPAQIVKVQIDNFYTGNVYAGIVNMKVDGVATQGFCIDPFHFSSKSELQYESIALADAPKAYLPYFSGEMGQIKADQISKLWGMAFSSSMTASQAAAMQLAIWEIVAGDLFTIKSLNDYGAAALLAQLDSYQGPKANLIALTGGGQDYVIATVPEAGATLVLLSLGVCGLAAFRRIRS